MINEKMTPELRKKMREVIELTNQTGLKEHGLVICKDENGDLQPGRLCKGEECGVRVFGKCSFKQQGTFHTHPSPRGRILSSLAKFELGLRGLSPITPSHQDLTVALTDKCSGINEGTTCIGSNIEPNKISCWTANIEIPPKGAYKEGSACDRALGEIGRGDFLSGSPKKWIKPLFDVEEIDTRK